MSRLREGILAPRGGEDVNPAQGLDNRSRGVVRCGLSFKAPVDQGAAQAYRSWNEGNGVKSSTVVCIEALTSHNRVSACRPATPR